MSLLLLLSRILKRDRHPTRAVLTTTGNRGSILAIGARGAVVARTSRVATSQRSTGGSLL